ncbi:MAG: hypothetical protein U0984_01500, partial [Prosthecobacter sp.]|nr:hypothetical protein [Prosthecobacter sp.]
MAVLGVFNLLVGKSKGDACCGHDHDHDHGHGHDHDHDHEHSHECGHDHGHVHTHDCGHDHGHDHAPAHTPAPAHTHEHGHECCGHDHDHDHSHAPAMAAHDHEDEHEEHAHSHCILSSPRWFNQSSAILVLLAPLALAAAYSPDQFSAKAVMNKNLYNPTYGVGARAEQFSLRTDDKGKIPAAKPAPARAPAVVDMPPPADNSSKVPGAPGPATAAAVAQTPATPPGAAKTQSYGSFTLADLEAQIPRNKNGNFELNVPEIYYTAGDAEVQKAIAGQTIETVAQVLPEKVNNANGHRLRVFRLLVQCCAADARPYSVPVDFGKKAPEIKDMTWVRVTGKLTYAKEGDQIVPIIQATGLEETTAPADAMIY